MKNSKVAALGLLFVMGVTPFAASADDASLTLYCESPGLKTTFPVHAGGEAKSPTVQINVYTDGPGVPNVTNTPVTCVAKINSGYKITGGRIDVSPTNIFTANNTEQKLIAVPRNDALLTHVQRIVGSPQVDSIDFTFKVPHNGLKGTINVVFVVSYAAT